MKLKTSGCTVATVQELCCKELQKSWNHTKKKPCKIFHLCYDALHNLWMTVFTGYLLSQLFLFSISKLCLNMKRISCNMKRRATIRGRKVIHACTHTHTHTPGKTCPFAVCQCQSTLFWRSSGSSPDIIVLWKTTYFSPPAFHILICIRNYTSIGSTYVHQYHERCEPVSRESSKAPPVNNIVPQVKLIQSETI